MLGAELDQRQTRIGLLLVLVATLLVHVPALFAGYPTDDALIASAVDRDGRSMPLVGELGSLTEYFTTHWWHGYYEASELFRPVTKLSIALVHAAFTHGTGPDAGAFWQHLANLLIHLWAVWLVWRLVRTLSLPALPALLAALGFGVLTIHSEAVCTIVGRAELLAFCFGAQATDLFFRGCARPGIGRIWRLVGAALLMFLAFGSKENALAWVPFLPILVLGRWLVNAGVRPAPRREGLCAVLVVLPPAVAFFALREQMIAGLGPVPPPTWGANPLAHVDAATRIFTAVHIVAFALFKTLFPVRLSADHGPRVFEPIESFADPEFLVPAVILIGLLGSSLVRARRQPLLFLGVAAFLGFAFPISNVPLAIGTIFAERLYYLPSLGLALMLAGAAQWAMRRPRPAIFLVAFVFWAGHCALYTFRRCLMWESTDSIALHDVEVQPRSFNLHFLASAAALRRQDVDAALRHLDRVVELYPGFTAGWLNRGVLLQRMEAYDEAEISYRQGLELGDRTMTGELAGLHRNLALLLERKGRHADALAEHRAALTLEPDSPRRVHQFLEAARGRVPEREIADWIARAERLQPGSPLWAYHRGLQALREGRLEDAERQLRQATQAMPGLVRAWLGLAETLVRGPGRAEGLDLLRRLRDDAKLPGDVRQRARALLQRLERR